MTSSNSKIHILKDNGGTYFNLLVKFINQFWLLHNEDSLFTECLNETFIFCSALSYNIKQFLNFERLFTRFVFSYLHFQTTIRLAGKFSYFFINGH